MPGDDLGDPGGEDLGREHVDWPTKAQLAPIIPAHRPQVADEGDLHGRAADGPGGVADLGVVPTGGGELDVGEGESRVGGSGHGGAKAIPLVAERPGAAGADAQPDRWSHCLT
jgi:hypothetical protein